LGERADLLCPLIWSPISGLVLFRDGSDKGSTSSFVQMRQAFGEESISHTRKEQFTETEKDVTGGEQSQEYAYHFLWHQGDCS
jgi:hypothetical protein